MRQIREVDGCCRHIGSYVDGEYWADIQIGDDADHRMSVRGDEVECSCNIATSTDALDREHLEALQTASQGFIPGLMADYREQRDRRRERARLAQLVR